MWELQTLLSKILLNIVPDFIYLNCSIRMSHTRAVGCIALLDLGVWSSTCSASVHWSRIVTCSVATHLTTVAGSATTAPTVPWAPVTMNYEERLFVLTAFIITPMCLIFYHIWLVFTHWDRVHCCRNQWGCHFPHIAVPHAAGQGLHRYVSFASYHLHKKHYMTPNLPRTTTCHPLLKKGR